MTLDLFAVMRLESSVTDKCGFSELIITILWSLKLLWLFISFQMSTRFGCLLGQLKCNP